MSRRRGWEVGRGQFLPEESFMNWESYSNAMRQVGSRFRDRVFARSSVEVEMTEVRARSGHDMKKNLNWWDLIWFGIGAVIGAGIFVLTGLEARDNAGPSTIVLCYFGNLCSACCVLLHRICCGNPYSRSEAFQFFSDSFIIL
jgi:APA family basic amino acid/polyamine antiporter